MIKIKTKASMNAAAIARRAKWAAASPLQKAASKVTRSAKASIKKSAKPSLPGQPPHTRGGPRSLQKSIRYRVNKASGVAIIGTSFFTTGLTGHYHEHGGIQKIKGKRRHYEIGKVGPVDAREGYVTPGRRGAEDPYATRHGIAFARIKSARMLLRAYALDRHFWPSAEQIRHRTYSKRSFIWPAFERNRSSIIKSFRNSIK